MDNKLCSLMGKLTNVKVEKCVQDVCQCKLPEITVMTSLGCFCPLNNRKDILDEGVIDFMSSFNQLHTTSLQIISQRNI